MSTEFRYGGKESSACRRGSDSPFASGGSGVGPQALRPERLQWLFNISPGSQLAAPETGLWPEFSAIALRLKAGFGHSPPSFFRAGRGMG